MNLKPIKICSICKDPFKPFNSMQKVCSTKCAIILSKIPKKTKEDKEKMKIMIDNTTTVQDYLKITQQVFNKFIRLRDAEQNCISCQKTLKIGNIDAGHMWSAGGHSNLRFNEYNVNSQCSRPCNKDKAGDINNYRLGFVERYGIEKLNEIDLIAKIEKRWDKDELLLLIKKYKSKCKELENKC